MTIMGACVGRAGSHEYEHGFQHVPGGDSQELAIRVLGPTGADRTGERSARGVSDLSRQFAAHCELVSDESMGFVRALELLQEGTEKSHKTSIERIERQKGLRKLEREERILKLRGIRRDLQEGSRAVNLDLDDGHAQRIAAINKNIENQVLKQDEKRRVHTNNLQHVQQRAQVRSSENFDDCMGSVELACDLVKQEHTRRLIEEVRQAKFECDQAEARYTTGKAADAVHAQMTNTILQQQKHELDGEFLMNRELEDSDRKKKASRLKQRAENRKAQLAAVCRPKSASSCMPPESPADHVEPSAEVLAQETARREILEAEFASIPQELQRRTAAVNDGASADDMVVLEGLSVISNTGPPTIPCDHGAPFSFGQGPVQSFAPHSRPRSAGVPSEASSVALSYTTYTTQSSQRQSAHGGGVVPHHVLPHAGGAPRIVSRQIDEHGKYLATNGSSTLQHSPHQGYTHWSYHPATFRP
jgi:hypothetical protein